MSVTLHPIQQAVRPIQHKMRAKSASLLMSIEGGLPRIMTIWFALAITGCAIRIVASPLQVAPDLSTFMPYMLLVGAPLVSMGLALMWFANGDRLPQPSTRLAVVGRWQKVSFEEASRHPLYGSSGIMVSPPGSKSWGSIERSVPL